jgi:hypothetical protein
MIVGTQCTSGKSWIQLQIWTDDDLAKLRRLDTVQKQEKGPVQK